MRMPKDKYLAYLQGPDWAARRAHKLQLADHRCEYETDESPFPFKESWLERCAETTGLHVHHRHYLSLGDEKPDDLEVLCERHHKVRHLEQQTCWLCGTELLCGEDDVEAALQYIEVLENLGEEVNVNEVLAPLCGHCQDILDKD